VIARGEQDWSDKRFQLGGNGTGVGVGVIEQVAGDEDHIGLEVVGLGDDVGEYRSPY